MAEDQFEKLLTDRASTGKSAQLLKRYTISAAICNVLGLFLLIFVLVINPLVFQSLVNSQVLLTNGTLSFEQWLSPTPTIYKIATAYNITNAAEVEAGGTPNVTAMGPYYFREYREKIRVEEVYSRELRYGERKWYEFDWNKTNHNRSGAPLDPKEDFFTTFNIAYIGVAYNLTLAGSPPAEIIAVIVDAVLNNDIGLLMNRSVNDVVFGYKDKFLELIQIVMPIPDTVQLVYNMSDKDISATSRIMNGRGKLGDMAQYIEWQGHKKLPYWKSDAANAVNGSEAMFFAPNLDKTKPITTFVDDLFRSNPLEYVGEEEVKTINTYKYQIPEYVQANASNNPLNDGFYAYGPNGLMNLTAAVMAPIFISKPSFLGAEDWLIGEVNGLPPADSNTMDTNLWVEPYTGVLVKALKQLQANMLVTRLDKFPGLQKLREKARYVPIANIVETGGMDDALIDTFKKKVFRPKFIFDTAVWVLFGTATFIGGVLWVLRWRCSRQLLKEASAAPATASDDPDVVYENGENVYNEDGENVYNEDGENVYNEDGENIYNDPNEDDEEIIDAYSVPEKEHKSDVYLSV